MKAAILAAIYTAAAVILHAAAAGINN